MADRALHVSLIAIPDAAISTLTGIYDVMNAIGLLAGTDGAVPAQSPFKVEIVGLTHGEVTLASRLAVTAHRGIDQIDHTDIVIVPSVLLVGQNWETGRYPALTRWLSTMHERGAMLCSACSGLFLLAETGLFDGVPSTVHWGYAAAFRGTFPPCPSTRSVCSSSPVRRSGSSHRARR